MQSYSRPIGTAYLWVFLFCFPAFAKDILITNATLLSPEREKPVEKAFVLIQDGMIKAVGAGNLPDVSADTETLDAKGQYLVPGLMDSHVHLMGLPGMNLPQRKKYPEIVTAYEKQMPRSYLYYGFTTLVDLNVADRGVLDNFKKQPFAPDLYDCGAGLSIANGYPMNYLDKEDRFEFFQNFIYDPKQKKQIPAKFKPSDHTPKAAVARNKQANAICTKVFYEPGFTPKIKLPVFDKKTLLDIKKESKKAELPVIVHANSLVAQRKALEGNPDIFAHGLWNWSEEDKKPGLPAPVKKILDTVIKNKIAYQPTAQVMNGLKLMYDDTFLANPRLTEVIPNNLLTWFKTKEGKWFPDSILDDEKLDKATLVKIYDGILSQLDRVIQYLDKNGGKLILGSDTPSAPVFANLPGLNGFMEMQYWRKAGVTPKAILMAATLRNAEAFNLDHKYGTIEQGKVANLLLLEKNPWESVDAYDSLNTVILRGVPIARAELKANQP